MFVAVQHNLSARLATFYSRSRGGRWCKGETSGHFINVQRVFLDCDRDSIIYLGDPIGPACHTVRADGIHRHHHHISIIQGAQSCWFEEVTGSGAGVSTVKNEGAIPRSTLLALEAIIAAREAEAGIPGAKPSWTAKLLGNPELLASKVREEAGELCEAAAQQEGRDRVASEAADLLYHALVLLRTQVCV